MYDDGSRQPADDGYTSVERVTVTDDVDDAGRNREVEVPPGPRRRRQ